MPIKDKIKVCPKCKSDKIDLDSGAITGQYWCRKCGYLGAVVLEYYKKK